MPDADAGAGKAEARDGAEAGAERRHSERKGALPLLSFRLTRVRDSFVCRVLLRFGNRADGAAVFTSSAVDALVRVDDVFAVTLGDCRDGAGVCARSARNAFIADNSCHGVHSFQRIGLPTDNIISHARAVQPIERKTPARRRKIRNGELVKTYGCAARRNRKASARGRSSKSDTTAARLILPRRRFPVRSVSPWFSALRACRS